MSRRTLAQHCNVVITDAAVEAAARSMVDASTWWNDWAREQWCFDMRKALEAAAPHLSVALGRERSS